MRSRLLMLLLLLAVIPAPARAGIFFNRTPAPPKPAPAERVPQLLKILKEDGDEHKRASAVDELRQFDLTAFPAIVPALIDAMLTDKKPLVRAEAAQALGKLKPMQNQIATALENARDKDESMRVRLQARSALLGYQWSGYHEPPKIAPVASKSAVVPTYKEPPLADPLPPVQPVQPVTNTSNKTPFSVIPSGPTLPPIPIAEKGKPMKDEGPELPPPGN